MQILAFCDHISNEMRGGAERVSVEMFNRLGQEPDVELVVLSAVDRRRPGSSPQATFELQRRRGLDLSPYLGAELLVAPGLLAATYREIRQRRPDVICVASVHFLGSVLGALASVLAQVPLVTVSHVSSIEHLPRRVRIPTRIYEGTIARLMLKSSTIVIAVSDVVAEHCKALGARPSSVVVVPNGVDADKFRPKQRRRRGARIAFIGRLIDNKGIIELLDAFQATEDPDIELVIAGTGPLQQAVEGAASTDRRIDYRGFCHDVHSILGSADIFVRMSSTEGRSLAILEAMAAGCGVIASDIPPNRELVTHGQTGVLLPHGATNVLRHELEKLCVDRHRSGSLGLAAREQVVGESWDGAYQDFWAVLAQAADN